jgi:hypothetical protein
MRPHWWAVLAVSLSLFALVAATSANHPAGDGRAAQPAPANRQEKGSAALPPTTTTSTTVPPAAPVSTVTPTTAAPATTPTYAAPRTVQVVARQPSTNTTTTTTTVPAAAGSNLAAATAQPVPTTEMNGALQQPDASSASYPFTGSGAMQISATSPSTTPLSLSVACPEGAQTAEGSSPVAVVIVQADGPCEVTLKEILVQYDVVPYVLTIGPYGG